MKERFDVTGMTCSACSSHVEKSVGKLTGVENVSVNLLTNSMQVEFDENKLDTAGIIKAVEDDQSIRCCRNFFFQQAASAKRIKTIYERSLSARIRT